MGISIVAEKASALEYWSLDGTLKWPDVEMYVYTDGMEETIGHVPDTITVEEAFGKTWGANVKLADDVAYFVYTIGIHNVETGTKWRIKFNRI